MPSLGQEEGAARRSLLLYWWGSFLPMKRVIFALLTLTLMTASPGWAAGLTLTIHEGRVSLDAQDVTIRQILAEWARVGKTRIVNLERVNSAPVTLKFDGLPEDE